MVIPWSDGFPHIFCTRRLEYAGAHGRDFVCHSEREISVATLEKLRRVLAYDLEHPEQKRERQRRYELTAAGRAAHRRYYTTATARKLNAAQQTEAT